MKITQCAWGKPENAYNNDVKVAVYGLDVARPGFIEDESYWKTTVNFMIDIEARSWGIKDITVTPTGMINLQVSISSETDETKMATLSLSFDASLLKREKMSSDSVTVGDIDLWVNPDLTPDYERSSIVIYGPSRRD